MTSYIERDTLSEALDTIVIDDLQWELRQLDDGQSYLESQLYELRDEFDQLCRWLGVDPFELDFSSRPSVWRRVWTWLKGG